MSTELKTLNGYGFDATKLGGLDAQYYAQGRAAHNLLDNSYFKKKREIVNQRGETSYTSGNEYTIDRWKTTYYTSLEIQDGYINVYGKWHVKQKLINPKNGVYTFAAKIRINSKGDNQPYMSLAGTVKFLDAPIGQWQTYVSTCDLSAVSDDEVNFVIDVSGNTTDGSLSVEWAALYEGSYTADTIPAYVPKDNELAECQRYYYQTWTGSSIGANGIITRQSMTPSRLASVDLPTTMRTTPTITLYNSSGTAGAVKDWNTSKVVSGMTVTYANSKSFVPANESSGLTAGNWYGFHYAASADL